MALEIEVELPRDRVPELLAELSRPDSDLKRDLPVAGIAARARPIADGGGGSRRGSAQEPLNASNFDAAQRLSRFRELQAQYATVVAQRRRTAATERLLQAMPMAGDAPDPGEEAARLAAASAMASAPFPPPGGLPWYYRGVPGVVEPRVRAPPERQRDATDADDLDEFDEGDEANGVNEDILFMKDGLDMGLQHMRTHGARMSAQSREYSRRLAEHADLAGVQEFSADPALAREWLRGQQTLREQQRIDDELKLEKRFEEEAQYWAVREQRQQLGGDSAEDVSAVPGGWSPRAGGLSPRSGSRSPRSGARSPLGGAGLPFAAFAGFATRSDARRDEAASLPVSELGCAADGDAGAASPASRSGARRPSPRQRAAPGSPAVRFAAFAGSEAPGLFDGFFGGAPAAPPPAPLLGVSGALRRVVRGACPEQALMLRQPDLATAREPRFDRLIDACSAVLAMRDEGALGEAGAAQAMVDYFAALIGNAEAVVQADEASRHACLVLDALERYPFCGELHHWGLEALMAIFQGADRALAEHLAGPIFDAAEAVLNAGGARLSKVPELPSCVAAALALVAQPGIACRLGDRHVDFALRVARTPEAGSGVMEHCLQLLLSARSAHRLRDQAKAVRDALRRFRSELRLVPRALLVLATIFTVAVDGGGVAPTGAASSMEPRQPAAGASEVLELVHVKSLVGEADDQQELMPIGLREVVNTMDLFAHDRKVQGAAAVAMAASTRLAGVALDGLLREGAVRAMVLAQQHYPASRSVALHMCEVIVRLARANVELLSPELALQAVKAGVAFPRDEEVVVTALEVVHAFARRMRELVAVRKERLATFAGDLVRLGEAGHEDPYAMSLLLVVLVAMASDGTGLDPGGPSGAQWRGILESAAAVTVPLRVLYEHADRHELVCAAAIALRCLSYASPTTCSQVGKLNGVAAMMSALRRYAHRHDTVRELLAALANCAEDRAVCAEVQRGLPGTAVAIYAAMGHSGDRDPDALAQGCRALGALYATVSGPDVDVAFNFPRIGQIVENVAASTSTTDDETMELFGRLIDAEELGRLRRQRLEELCQELCARQVGNGSVFGRLLGRGLKPTAECVPRVRLQRRGQ